MVELGPPSPPPGTCGAMSPDPVTVNLPPACRNVSTWPVCGPNASWFPTLTPLQEPGRRCPRRLTWSKIPVARLGPICPVVPPKNWDSCW